MKKRGISLMLALFIIAGLLSSCQNTPPSDTAPSTASSANGGEAGWGKLAIQTRDLNGATVTAADFSKNKLTVLNIWATWCPPCIRELPELQAVSQAFSAQGVQVVGVLQDGITEAGKPNNETIKNAQALLDDAGASYTVLLPDEILMTEFISQMQYFPTTFFIDRNGKVVHIVTGAKDFKAWSGEINGLLSKMP